LFLLFLPHFLGAPKGEWILLPRRAAAFREGPIGFEGGTGKAEDAKASGRRNYPESVPKKMSGRKRDAYLSQ
jgi:hypothetical protein